MNGERTWLLLLHHLPPKPGYLRAKVMRRMNQIGALGVKNAAYLLPATDDCLEDFQWLLREIEEGSGTGWLFETHPVWGTSNEELEESFRALRERDYVELREDARKLLERLRQPTESHSTSVNIAPSSLRELSRLRTRFLATQRIDFFEAPGAREVQILMEEIEKLVEAGAGPSGRSPREVDRRAPYRARLWVTRSGVKEDRIASAWLIRRFIDPAAQFRFVDPKGYQPAEGELRFDMFDGDFTHRDELCTFEVLMQEFELQDEGLRGLGEIIHDIDLKDDRHGRPETPGVALAIEGMVLRNEDDSARLEGGFMLLDALYERLRRQRR